MTKYAKTYAGALYDLAQEEHIEEEVLKDLSSVCDMLRSMPEYLKLLSTPAISKAERKTLLEEAWMGNISQYSLNFLRLLCDGNSISEIFNCQEEFESRFNADRNIINVTVISAVKLSDKQREELLAAVEKKTGKKINLEEKIDESIIAGLKLQVEGKQYDGTVAYHLDSIAHMLSAN